MVAGGCVGYDKIRSMSRQYASYWNAFLFLFGKQKVKNIISILKSILFVNKLSIENTRHGNEDNRHLGFSYFEFKIRLIRLGLSFQKKCLYLYS